MGFPLAILFFMDQMIVTCTVDNNQNKFVFFSIYYKKKFNTNLRILNIILWFNCRLGYSHFKYKIKFLFLNKKNFLNFNLNMGGLSLIFFGSA